MRLELPEQRKLVYEVVVPIRWGDMDAFGHVNNTVYFRYMEIARIGWLDSIAQQAGVPGQEDGFIIILHFVQCVKELHNFQILRAGMAVDIELEIPFFGLFKGFYQLEQAVRGSVGHRK